jgi:hypothetical protein
MISDNCRVEEQVLFVSTTTEGEEVGEFLGVDEAVSFPLSPRITEVSKWCLSQEERVK